MAKRGRKPTGYYLGQAFNEHTKDKPVTRAIGQFLIGIVTVIAIILAIVK